MVSVVSNSTSTTSTSTSASTTSAATSSLTSNYETFLSLLTAQIKNQDPLSPMDSTEWTSQLVQYSSVEQQLKANEYLSSLVDLSAGNMSSSVSMIGKTATAAVDTQTYASGDSLTWHYELAADAANVQVEVLDANGDTVYKGTSDGLTSGDNTFTWDGTNSSGTQVAAGNYTLKVTATNSAGSTVSNSISVQQRVTGTELVDGEIVLKMGSSLIPMSYVTGVRESDDA